MEEKPRWGFFDLGLIYLGSLLLTSLLAGWVREGGAAALFYQGREITEFQIFIITYFCQFAVLMTLILVITLVWRGSTINSLGIRWPASKDWIRYGLLGGILAAVFILLSGAVIQKVHPQLPPQSFELILRAIQDKKQFMALLLVGSVLAPLSEELFYRGMVYPVFRWHWGKAGGMAAAGVIFGLAHMDLWRAIPLALGGMFLCYVYEKSDSILVSTMTHGIWNGILTIIIYFSINVG